MGWKPMSAESDLTPMSVNDLLFNLRWYPGDHTHHEEVCGSLTGEFNSDTGVMTIRYVRDKGAKAIPSDPDTVHASAEYRFRLESRVVEEPLAFDTIVRAVGAGTDNVYSRVDGDAGTLSWFHADTGMWTTWSELSQCCEVYILHTPGGSH
jgi:hypothetical protein